jgi:hypothetical protein
VSTTSSGSAGTSPRGQAFSAMPATTSQLAQQLLLQAQSQSAGQYSLLHQQQQAAMLPLPVYMPQQQGLALGMQHLQQEALRKQRGGRYAPRQPPPPGRLFVGQLDGAVNESMLDAVFSTCGRVIGTKVSRGAGRIVVPPAYCGH